MVQVQVLIVGLLAYTGLAVLLFSLAVTQLFREPSASDPNPDWPTWAIDIPRMAHREEDHVREPVVKADEQDVVTGWRRLMIWRPGEVAKIKRRIRRRERHVARHRMRREQA